MNVLFESSYLSIMSEQNDKLREENNQLKDRIEKATNNLEHSIKSINEKLSDKEIRCEDGRIVNPPNDYIIVRLKGIRTKCKEILEILKGEEQGDIK